MLRVAEEMTRAARPAWWVPAVDSATVTARLLDLAQDLGAPPGEVAEAMNGRRDPADLLWRYLEVCPGWLLVFDNADDLEALTVGGNDAAGGAGWLRPSAAGLIIVTSREGNLQAWGRHAELHPVGWLDAATGAQVLADLAPEAGPAEDAAALSDRLGGLPLALHHAGSQMASPFAAERTFAAYARALDERFGRLMGHGAADDRAIVTRTWELSLDALAGRGRPQARPLLQVLSCLAPAVLIPARVLDLGVLGRVCQDGEDGAAEGLAALALVGLITVSPGQPGSRRDATVHPLVTETSRLCLDTEDPVQAGSVAVALLATAAAGLDHDRPEDWPAWVQLGPHLNAVYGYLASRLAGDDLAAIADVTTSATEAFLSAGSYLAAQELATSALEDATRLGADHAAVLTLGFQVATAHLFRGKYAEAEQEFRDLLAARLRVLGPGHPDTLAVRHEIARTLAARGRYEQAEQEYREVLAARLRVLGPDHHSTLTTRHQVARMLARRGRYEQAEQQLREVLAARLRVLGPDHRNTLATRHEIARMLAERGQYEQAEREYRDVLAAALRVLGPDHHDTLVGRYGVARMVAKRGQIEQAKQELRDVLAAQIRVLGSEHPSALASRHEIARMLAERGQYEQAEREYRDVLAVEMRVLGPDHPDTRATRDSLTMLEIRARRPS